MVFYDVSSIVFKNRNLVMENYCLVVIVVFVNVFAIVVVVFVNESGLHSQPACEWRSEVTFLA